MTNNSRFMALKIKVRRRACPERSRRGLYSFAFSLTSYGINSTKEQVRKNKLFLQNKANFRKVKFDVTKVLTKDYDQLDTWSIRKTKPIKANKSQLKPIKANKTQKQTQFKPKQTQFQKANLLMDRLKSKLLLNFQLKINLTGLCNSLKYWVLYCERDFL
jgi:hypothetical protein